jgi:hypothetical protein
VIPHWVDRVWELTHRQRECRPSLLDQLSRHQRVFAELPKAIALALNVKLMSMTAIEAAEAEKEADEEAEEEE